MKADKHDIQKLKTFVGGRAIMLLFTATHIHLAIRVQSLSEPKEIYLLLDGCRRIEAPVAWAFRLPELSTDAEGLVTIEDVANGVLFVCEFFRILDNYEPPFGLGNRVFTASPS